VVLIIIIPTYNTIDGGWCSAYPPLGGDIFREDTKIGYRQTFVIAN